MVTRITAQQTATISADLQADSKTRIALYKHQTEKSAAMYNMYYNMLNYITKYPETTADQLIEMFATPLEAEQTTVKPYSKKKRTYNVNGVTITEEDI